MLLIAITVLHVIVCIFLIIVVLLQQSKSADIAGAFGGMGSQTAFGPRGAASVLSKATTTAVIIFMLTSMALTVMTKRTTATGGSVMDDHKAPTQQTQPAPQTPPPSTPQK